ncbi:hypothetical protein RBH29_10885 [Herbivorax sp. ANBcel31]|uniref:hypothetical protein n=1 Tax=Herbivorax sp. ANBcel31 TaxID=3069754 RepID=UPI0027B5BB5D|nr:hypothetical protein [Herbivorax sp. ANBcel31]MDQ2086932.1 hypothetical protein [Herbivorax sp. ANBcel31]
MFKKYYITFVSVAAIIIVFATGFIKINSTKTNWNFEFKTIHGDESVLEGVKISGEMIDENSLVNFSITEDKTKSSFEYFGNFREYRRSRPYMSNYYYRYDNYYYEIDTYAWDSEGNLRIVKGKINNRRRVGAISVPIHFTITRNILGKSWKYIAGLNGRIFFIIPRVRYNDTEGKYIYEAINFNSDEEESFKKIKDIPLNFKKQLIGLFSVNDKLCILISDGEHMTLKSFDVETNEFLDEYKFTTKSEYDDFDVIGKYINGETLVLDFNNRDLYAFNVGDEIKMFGHVSNDKRNFEIENNLYRGEGKKISFIEDKFYILGERLKSTEEERYLGAQNEFRSILELLVYDKDGDEVYYGRVISDISDDNIRNMQFNEKLLGNIGDIQPYRRYINYRVEEEENHAESL